MKKKLTLFFSGWESKRDLSQLKAKIHFKFQNEDHLLREILPSQAEEARNVLAESLREHPWFVNAAEKIPEMSNVQVFFLHNTFTVLTGGFGGIF